MSETATADAAETATDTAQTDTNGQTDTEGAAPPEPWYARLKPSEDDVKIYGKYKDPDEAIKSIPSRERGFHSRIPLPAADAKPEEAVKAHRSILGKLGAYKDASGYKQLAQAAYEKLPESVKEHLPEARLDHWAERALALNMLPWQFESELAEAFNGVEAQIQSAEEAKLERQDALEKAMKTRYGVKWQTPVTNAETMATHMDEFLRENAKGLGIEGEDGKVAKDAFTQRLKLYNDPVLYAAFEHLYDVLLSEGTGSPRRLGGKVDDAHSQHYNYAKTHWPNRGEAYWADYAKRMTKREGGEA